MQGATKMAEYIPTTTVAAGTTDVSCDKSVTIDDVSVTKSVTHHSVTEVLHIDERIGDKVSHIICDKSVTHRRPHL